MRLLAKKMFVYMLLIVLCVTSSFAMPPKGADKKGKGKATVSVPTKKSRLTKGGAAAATATAEDEDDNEEEESGGNGGAAASSAERVFVYYLKYAGRYGDVIVYCGITNDPEARAIEHARGGTMRYNTFDTMVVFAGPMSRDQAYREETRCIERNRIPRIYQHRNGPDFRAIEEYELHYNPTRLIQTPNPRVEYTAEVLRAVHAERTVCEDCGSDVTAGVIDFSRRNFDGHVFCMRCQHHHDEEPVCEDCGSYVTAGVIDFSLRNFAGHIFCMRCQHEH